MVTIATNCCCYYTILAQAPHCCTSPFSHLSFPTRKASSPHNKRGGGVCRWPAPQPHFPFYFLWYFILSGPDTPPFFCCGSGPLYYPSVPDTSQARLFSHNYNFLTPLFDLLRQKITGLSARHTVIFNVCGHPATVLRANKRGPFPLSMSGPIKVARCPG